jgi:hypothetical protein
MLNNFNNEFIKFRWVEEVYETYTKLLTERSKVKDECGILSRNIIIITNELEKLDIILKEAIHKIELYHRNETSVIINENINKTITIHRKSIVGLDIEFQKKRRSQMDISGKRDVFKVNIERIIKISNEVVGLENESESYHNYLTSVSRDGIPYQVICNIVPEIEKEVNLILSQIVDYTIQFDTDGKNIIPYITYSDIGKYQIELASGYERFIASIAIRVALTEISNLPRTNMLCIDEGFGTLDPDNLSSMPVLFSLLRNYFDFIIIISHLNVLKDIVDKTIDIKQEGNFSKVVFE